MIYDITFIGFGIAGMYGTFLSKIRNLNTLVLESNFTYGGKLSHVYNEKEIIDFPGYHSIRADKLANNFYFQATNENDNLTLKLGEEVITIEKEDELFTINTIKTSYKTKYIIITDGNGLFSPRKLNHDYSNVFYTYCSIDFIKDKEVTVFGGGDSAIDFCLTIKDHCKCTLIHRRNEFRGLPANAERLKNEIKVLTPYNLEESDSEELTNIKLINSDTNEVLSLHSDISFVFFGITSRKNNYLELEKDHNLIKVNEFMETSISNIFACGDAIYYPSKVRMIVSATSEVLIAIEEIDKRLNPTRKPLTH